MIFKDLNHGASVQIIDEEHPFYEKFGKVAGKYEATQTCKIVIYGMHPPMVLEVKPEQLAHIAN